MPPSPICARVAVPSGSSVGEVTAKSRGAQGRCQASPGRGGGGGRRGDTEPPPASALLPAAALPRRWLVVLSFHVVSPGPCCSGTRATQCPSPPTPVFSFPGLPTAVTAVPLLSCLTCMATAWKGFLLLGRQRGTCRGEGPSSRGSKCLPSLPTRRKGRTPRRRPPQARSMQAPRPLSQLNVTLGLVP